MTFIYPFKIAKKYHLSETDNPLAIDYKPEQLADLFQQKYFGAFKTRDINNLRRTTDRPEKEINRSWENLVITLYKISIVYPNNIISRELMKEIEILIGIDSSKPANKIIFTYDGYEFCFNTSTKASNCTISLIEPKDDPSFKDDVFQNSPYYNQLIEFQNIVNGLD